MFMQALRSARAWCQAHPETAITIGAVIAAFIAGAWLF
jgi:ABC-type nitrate/sulfonate/bicarbonate transport system substrate-binding protein